MSKQNLNPSEPSLSQLLAAVEKSLDGMAAAPSHSGILHDEIDKYASDLARILLKAKRLKNTFPPINHLPPEILGLVPTFFQTTHDLITATAVCSHWRVTFLSTPRLWCHISGHSTSMANAYLERSGGVPLYLRDLASPKVATLLRPHMERVASLEVEHGNSVRVSQIMENLRDPAPILNTLSFYASGDDLDGLKIPSHFLGGSFPSLRTLVLTKIPSFAGQHTLLSVTTLIWTTTSSLIDQLLMTLGSLPSLEAATIQFHSPHVPRPEQVDYIITLQRLRTLNLTVNSDRRRGPRASLPPILPLINLPDLTKLSMQTGPSYSGCLLPSSVLFTERLPKLSELQEAEISLLKGNSARVRFSGPCQSELVISIGSMWEVFQALDPFGGIPFHPIRRLTVHFEEGAFGTSNWALGVLKNMVGVEVLEVVGECANFFYAWNWREEYHRICPSLHRLTVCSGVRRPPKLSAVVDVRSSVGLPLIITYKSI